MKLFFSRFYHSIFTRIFLVLVFATVSILFTVIAVSGFFLIDTRNIFYTNIQQYTEYIENDPKIIPTLLFTDNFFLSFLEHKHKHKPSKIITKKFRKGNNKFNYINWFERPIIRYTNYLIQDIGYPPDFEKAKSLAQKLSLIIIFKSSLIQWSTARNGLEFETVDDYNQFSNYFLGRYLYSTMPSSNPNVSFVGTHGKHYIVVNKPTGTYAFGVDFIDREYREFLIVLLIIAIASILTFSLLWIMRILLPLRRFRDAVIQVGKGKYDFYLKEKGKSEFAKIAHSFNQMTKRVSSSLYSKQQLLLNVSHELRTPLSRIKLTLEFMQKDSEHTESIKEDIIEMEQMINELLESARLDSKHGSLNFSNIEMNSYIQQIIDNLFVNSHSIHFTPAADPIDIKVDVVRLETLFNNIVQNAIKYSPVNSSIDIDCRQEKKKCHITIKDYGIGIPESELEYIFEPFYCIDKSRTKKNNSFGLGLSLCKKIVDAHGGDITIHSHLHKGTQVDIFLPI